MLLAGHKIRDAVYNRLPNEVVDTGETYDCVIVGGGISGIAAALLFQRKAPSAKCLILENHPIFGGEAKQNEFLVDGKRLIAHQGSAIYQLQEPQSFLTQFYQSIGLESPKLSYQKWAGPQPEMPLSRTPYDAVGMDYGQYGFWFGAKFGHKPGLWVMDPVRKKFARRSDLRFLTNRVGALPDRRSCGRQTISSIPKKKATRSPGTWTRFHSNNIIWNVSD